MAWVISVQRQSNGLPALLPWQRPADMLSHAAALVGRTSVQSQPSELIFVYCTDLAVADHRAPSHIRSNVQLTKGGGLMSHCPAPLAAALMSLTSATGVQLN